MEKLLALALLCVLWGFGCCALEPVKKCSWTLNTSNKGKYEEFKRLFATHGCVLNASHVDLDEIDADPISVVAHKASQLGDGIVIEDTSLDIEGASVGVNVRWLIDHLDQYVGKKAVWTVLLAFRKDNQVYIFEGKVHGQIVSPQGTGGFGFDPVFQPEGSSDTLAVAKPDEVNARALAVDALISNRVSTVSPPIDNWDGPWQKHD